MKISRRNFVNLVTFGTAASVIGGKLWQCEVLAFCIPPPGPPDGVFKVRVSDYPALLQDWGSVRLGINPVWPDLEPYPDGAFYPFLINRDNSRNFYVVDCECRHASCVVPTFDDIEFAIRCPCHGSTYSIDGTNLGGPATHPLYQYDAEFDGNDTLTIRIPCWGFDVNAAVLPGGANSRIRVDFAANPNVTYEVSFRERLQDPWRIIPFATSPAGPANQTTIKTFGGNISVYLDRSSPSGFYAVGMKLSEV